MGLLRWLRHGPRFVNRNPSDVTLTGWMGDTTEFPRWARSLERARSSMLLFAPGCISTCCRAPKSRGGKQATPHFKPHSHQRVETDLLTGKLALTLGFWHGTDCPDIDDNRPSMCLDNCTTDGKATTG
ncbi:hypothetical protein N7510_000822 [Penicillium lagena]|uniref:uncharacterized protein n=1 Tax=Penicillium lagena TaxID=94218 RepID=UPI0025410D80|nr:uncharacterized protein N7510_000822 [Penicillium lagena]KAJ5624513.1 hypothetical protein N7510_000822 [Penicillium lagena]